MIAPAGQVCQTGTLVSLAPVVWLCYAATVATRRRPIRLMLIDDVG